MHPEDYGPVRNIEQPPRGVRQRAGLGIGAQQGSGRFLNAGYVVAAHGLLQLQIGKRQIGLGAGMGNKQLGRRDVGGRRGGAAREQRSGQQRQKNLTK